MTKREARKRLIAECERGAKTIWLNVEWIDALGRQEITALLTKRFGYDPPKPVSRGL